VAARLPGCSEVVRCTTLVQAAVLDTADLVQRHQQELVVAVRVLDQHIAAIRGRLHAQAIAAWTFGAPAVTFDQSP